MRRAILAIVSTAAALVLLLSFKTHSTSAVATPPAALSGSGGSGGGGAGTGTRSAASPSASGGSTPAKSGKSSKSSTASASKTVTGDAADTIYGPVQVAITVKSGKITAVNAVQYPQGSPRDAQINSYAIPVLNQEALAAGSAHIDAVSGATYTSNGYVTSLQSALDKAGV
jgi:uncharacterized protein with FMN-binding domain